VDGVLGHDWANEPVRTMLKEMRTILFVESAPSHSHMLDQGEPVAGPSTHGSTLAEEEDARVTETHPTTGTVIQMEETVHAKWQRHFGLGDGEEAESDLSDDEDGNLFYPFASHLDWQVGCWAVQEGIGHKAFDRLFAIPGVREHLGLAYYNIRGLHQTIDSIPPRAKWQSTYLAFNDTPDYT
ncbi:hypothetical protein DEU56DRAFT_704831, partial [Suillus clintonianus]|uniref:uncharacterized protein n=1 Tax=Suillus clintonianus TaxID=1904413 RepID=UPI001B8847C3